MLFRSTPTDVGGQSQYTGNFPFTSISDDTIGTINFRDTASVICANCHSTMNHIAPLFANFDETGALTTAIAVHTPLVGAPLATLADYLPAGEVTAWRNGTPAADLPALGQAMAADPDVSACAVARVWNWALGKGDIVDALQVVPTDVIASQVQAFTTDGFKMKDLIAAVFKSDDFTKF